MPHLAEAWDQSDSDSDTNTTTAPEHLFGTKSDDEQEDDVCLTLEQLGLESDTDSDSAETEREVEASNNKGKKRKGKKGKKSKKTSLPERGYLFEDKVDITNIMDPADMGLQVLQARRKGKMEMFKAPARYMESMKEKFAGMAAKKEGRPNTDSLHWGDKPVYRESWPKIDTKGNLRILFYNVNGISALEDFIEMEMLMQTGAQEQADILMVTELNLNLHNKSIKSRLIQTVKQYDKYAKVQFSYPPENPNTTRAFNMGGTMIIVQGALAGRIGTQGADKLGRWSWMELKGDGDKSLILTCAYRVGRSKGTIGGTSISQQEIRGLLKQNHDLASKPRAAFNLDFSNFSTEKQNEGKEVLILMDANTPIDSAENRTFLASAGLIDIATSRHPDLDLPRTYQDGSRCIDEAAGTKKALSWVTAYGLFPFFQHGLYDHRGSMLDLACAKFLATFKPDATRRMTHKLKASIPSKSDAYCKNLISMLTRAGIFNKMDELYTDLYVASPKEQVQRIKKIKIYNGVARDLMIAAENKLGPKSPLCSFWSPTLQAKGRELSYYNECIKTDEVQNDLGINVRTPKHVTRDESITSREDLESKRLEVKLSWNQTTKQGPKLRRDFLQEKAQRATETRNVKYEAALKQIINAETSRALHQRHGYIIKEDGKRGGIKSILVPRPGTDLDPPSSKYDDGWITIDNDKWINSLFSAINRRKLCMSNGSAMAPGGILHNIIGPHGTSEAADEILKGSFDIEQLTPIDDIDIKTLHEFVKQMARPRNEDGEYIPDMEWKFDEEDYQKAFSKKNEETSCGPSGLHMSHWKAIGSNHQLCVLFAKFIEIPFKLGFTYDRWETSFHTMIMKKAKPWANAMRIVQLLEGDYNAGLRYLVQRCVSAHAEKKNIYGDSTYGGRKGKNTHQVLGRIQGTIEYSRLGRIPAALADVDAKNCFDCMTHAGIGFFQRRQGSPKDLVTCQCTTLHQMKHYIKTGRGVSKDPIKAQPGQSLEGSGQGAGSSVGNWQGHNDPMIKTFEQLCQPCTLTSPSGADALIQWIMSFIDDNKITMNFEVETEIQRIYESIRKGVQCWREILRITGGELELEKSFIGILTFDFDTYQEKNMGTNSPHKVGLPRIVPSSEYAQTVLLDQSGRDITLKEIDPDQGLRLLGVRMSLSGDFTDELEYRANQVLDMSVKIRAAALDARDGWMIYQTRYRPMMRYCLPITTFSAAECNKIQGPFISAIINCLGMNRNTKRVACHGPLRLGGMAIMDVATEQFASRLHLIMTNVRKGNPTGRAMVHAMSMYQMHLGCERPFFELDPSNYPVLPSTTLSCQFLWNELRKIKAVLTIPSMWKPTSTTRDDRAIIDSFVETIKERKGTPGFINPIAIYQANACRLYLKVTWISDICTFLGDRIAPWAFFGTRPRRTSIIYPHQEKPPESAWKIWRKLLRCSLVATSKQQLPHAYFPLHKPLQEMNMTQMPQDKHSLAPPNAPLQEIIDGMSASWRQVLGSVDFPDDDGDAIAQILNSGGTIKAWSDGTVKVGVGAHAYTLRTKCEDGDLAITGDAATPGNPSDISSLRPESYGGLACLILIWAIEYKYGIQSSGYVLLHIDNQEVVNRIKYGVPDAMAAEKFTKTDFDVWLEIAELAKTLRTAVCARWVRGHQDKRIKGVFAGIGPIHIEGKFNILMDRRAEQRREASTVTRHTIPFKTERATLMVNASIVTTKISDYITEAKTGPPMAAYIREKTGWAQSTYDKVDWIAMGIYMKKIGIATRAKVVKLQHNWQNTGRQKGLFLESAGASHQAIQAASTCPMGCGNYEAPLHYLTCTKNPKGMETASHIKNITKWLRNQDTAPALVGIVSRILYKFTQREPTALDTWNFGNEPNQAELNTLVDDQKEIGWDNFFRGRMATGWSKIQSDHYATLDMPECQAYKTGSWWTSNLIRQVIYFSLNSWQIRNDVLHKDKVATEYKRERDELCARGRFWYRNASKLGKRMQKYFKRTTLEREKDSNQQIACWIDTLEAHYKYLVERGKDSGRVPLPEPRERRGG